MASDANEKDAVSSRRGTIFFLLTFILLLIFLLGVFLFSRQSVTIAKTLPLRTVQRTFLAKEQAEGDGATVRRSIGGPSLRSLDPFLLLDEFHVRPPAGFPDHPHRGFETVTYMIQGKFQHKDNKGHQGMIGPGDLQWMTAGRGIVHSEMPATENDNVGLQLWVNLPSSLKMMPANYQELNASDVPVVKSNGARIIVIAGTSISKGEAKVRTQSPILYVDVHLDPGASVNHPLPRGYRSFAYVLSGRVLINDEVHGVHGTFIQFRDEEETDTTVQIEADSELPARLVLLGGHPLNEPIFHHGPFVMNTEAEIRQAIEDYRNNLM